MTPKRLSVPLTRGLADRIWHLRRTTDLFQHQIAAQLSINQGRVSEVLTGKRFPDARLAS